MKDALYDLENDPLEKTNLFDRPEMAGTIEVLRTKLTAFFETHSQPDYDLGRQGSAKSNVTYQKLWQDAWGDDWRPEFST